MPLQGWLPRDEDGFLPRDEDGFPTLPIGALAHAVLWGCESDLAVTTKELKAVSDDWLRGMELGSVKKAWWQTMHLRRLRQKTTVPKYDVWSEIRKLRPDAPDTRSSLPRTRWQEDSVKFLENGDGPDLFKG